MNVLSLFDGLSGGQIALDRAGIKVDNYYASEVDKNAMKVAKHNYPNINHIGDVREVSSDKLNNIDILIGGSPCQNFSICGKRQGMVTSSNEVVDSFEKYIELKNDGFEFDGQSYLFWEYVRLLTELSPKHFLLENVVMVEKWKNIITNALGVEPIEINSNLLSAQNRRRLYWTNIPNVKQPDDLGITANDAMQKNEEFKPSTICFKNKRKFVKHTGKKMSTLTTYCNNPNGLGRPFWSKNEFFVDTPFDHSKVEKLTVNECEILQTVPLNYTNVEGISDYQKYRMLGNGWTIDVIAHILKNLK